MYLVCACNFTTLEQACSAMEIILYVALFMATFLVLVSKLVIEQRTKRSENWPPSPPSLPIIGHLHLLRDPRHLSLSRLAERYGPVVFLRLGARPALVVSSPSAAEEIFTKNDTILANRPRILAGKILGHGNTSLFFVPYGQHWWNLRRLATVELLSTNRLNMMSGIRTEVILHLVKRLWTGVDREGRGEVKLRPRFLETAYNAVSEVVVGKRYYGDDATEESEEAKRVREIISEAIQMVFSFNPGDFFPILEYADIRGLGRKMVKLQQRVDEFMDSLIEEHRGKNSDSSDTEAAAKKTRRKTLIDVMLSLQESDRHYYTDDILKGLVMTLLGAGTDGVAETMESAILLLLRHPEILKKARTEIDIKVGQGRVLNELDLPNLSYLHCIIQETLRLCPPAQGMPPRETSEDCTIQGFHVPRGTMLFVNMWAIQRDPQLWDEPTSFKPERFEGGKVGREEFKYFPFGSGRRICPGEGMTMRMLELSVGALIQCFEWETVGEEEVDLNAVIGLTTPKDEPFVATYRRRDSMMDAITQL